MHDDAKLYQILQDFRQLHLSVTNTPIHDMLMIAPEFPQRATSGAKREKSPSPERAAPKSKAKATPKKSTRPNPEADNEPERTTKKSKKTENIKKDK